MYHKTLFLVLCISIITVVVTVKAQHPTWVEKDGYVIVEMESTRSPLGKWVKKSDNPDYTGTCHLEFTGNTINGGDPTSPLHYKFKINKAGVYELKFRCRKRLDGADTDKCNDAYVRVEGDFTTGANASLEVLKEDTKLFGGPENGWGWSNKLDPHSGKVLAKYTFKSDEVYELVVSGRSVRYNIDRIVFNHSTADLGPAATAPESDTLDVTPVINYQLHDKTPQSHIVYINGIVKLNDLPIGTYSLFVQGVNGRTLVKRTVQVSGSGEVRMPLDLADIAQGVYVTTLMGNGLSEKIRFIVN